MKKEKEMKKEKALARKEKKKHDKKYARTWGTPIGQDCIDLDETLCTWLGQRLVFLGEHTSGYPLTFESYESWQNDLCKHGQALLRHVKLLHKLESDDGEDEARQALEYVALNFRYLRD